MSTGKFLGEPDEILGVTFLMEWHPIQKGVAILLVATCYGNWYKLQLSGQVAQVQTFHFYYTDFGFPTIGVTLV